MEVLRLHGYTEQEKWRSPSSFLVKKQMLQAGLSEKNVKFSDDAITTLIRAYTREAGVRNLERENRQRLPQSRAQGSKGRRSYTIAVTGENVTDFLGVIKFRDTLAHERAKWDWSPAWPGLKSEARF